MTTKRAIAPLSLGMRQHDWVPEYDARERGVVRLTRRGRYIALVVVTVLMFAAFSVGRVMSQASSPAHPVVTHSVVVSAGDTLWRIALREAPDRDPREVVDLIERTNHIDAGLQIGQTIVVPDLS